jgi:hypothetical protein
MLIGRNGVPADDEVAASMRRLADAFVQGMAEEGQTFAWDTQSARLLDGACEQLLASKPTDGIRDAFSIALGSYLGELIIRNCGGRWTYHEVTGMPAVEIAAGHLCFPHAKVSKRLSLGEEHSLWVFYDYILTGRLAPGSKITPREWDAGTSDER